jgi:hypothetical protein
MPTFAELACQYQRSPTPRELDTALLRLFPKIPDDARRTLRDPLKRCQRGAVKFLSSPQTRVDDHLFASVCLGLPGLYAAEKRPDIAALLCGLRGEIDTVLTDPPTDCECRYSCALLHVIDWLFNDVDSRPGKRADGVAPPCNPFADRE